MLRLKAKELSSSGIYRVVKQLETSPRCMYESENNFGAASTEKSFKSCGIANALNGSEDVAVWEKENEETEDAEEIIDNEFETGSKGKEGE